MQLHLESFQVEDRKTILKSTCLYFFKSLFFQVFIFQVWHKSILCCSDLCLRNRDILKYLQELAKERFKNDFLDEIKKYYTSDDYYITFWLMYCRLNVSMKTLQKLRKCLNHEQVISLDNESLFLFVSLSYFFFSSSVLLMNPLILCEWMRRSRCNVSNKYKSIAVVSTIIPVNVFGYSRQYNRLIFE